MGQLFLFKGLFRVVFVVVSFWDYDNRDNIGQLFLFKGLFHVVFVVVSFKMDGSCFSNRRSCFYKSWTIFSYSPS